MERKIITNKTYKILNPSKENLKKLGFVYDMKNKYYTYKFTVLSYKGSPVLKCVLTIEEDENNVKIDVYGTDNNFYAPFYGSKYGNYDKVLATIDKRIVKEFKKLKIVEFDHGI